MPWTETVQVMELLDEARMQMGLHYPNDQTSMVLNAGGTASITGAR